MNIKPLWLKELLKKHSLQLLSIYILTVVFNIIGYIGMKYKIEWLQFFEFNENRILVFIVIFAVYYIAMHLKNKTFAFTPFWKKKFNVIAIGFSWLTVVLVLGNMGGFLFEIANNSIYQLFDMMFSIKTQPSSNIIRLIVNLTVADAIIMSRFLTPFIIANMLDKLFDRNIISDTKERNNKYIRTLNRDEQLAEEGRVFLSMLFYFVGLTFVWVIIELAYCGGNSWSDILIMTISAIQLAYIFTLGKRGSFVGLGYVIACTLVIIYELYLIQNGIQNYAFVTPLVTMPPRWCATAFSWVMNLFMNGGFRDISYHHTYLFMVPGVIIFILIYVSGVLVHILQRKFQKTVDKSL